MIVVGPQTEETGEPLWPVYDDADPENWFFAFKKKEHVAALNAGDLRGPRELATTKRAGP